MTYYMLTATASGDQWVGPYTMDDIRARRDADRLPDSILLLRASDRARTTIGRVLAPPRSLFEDIVEGAVVVATVVGAALLIREIGFAFTTTREQQAIRASARAHLADGAKAVYADHVPGWDRPPVLKCRRRPDVIAVYARRTVVEEHETTASAGRRHSIEQDRDLRRWAKRQKNVSYEQIIS